MDSWTVLENAKIAGGNLPPVARQAWNGNRIRTWQRESISTLSPRNMQVDHLGPRVKIPLANRHQSAK